MKWVSLLSFVSKPLLVYVHRIIRAYTLLLLKINPRQIAAGVLIRISSQMWTDRVRGAPCSIHKKILS